MQDDQSHNANDAGHEPIAVSANLVAKGFAILFAVVAVVLVLMIGLSLLFSQADGGKATVEPPADFAEVTTGVPVLESNQRASLRALRERERQVLTEYAWIDRQTGVARIPIKRAMEIMAQNVRPTAEAATNARPNQ